MQVMPQENKSERKLSLILLSYYSGTRIRACYETIQRLLNAANISFEFIIMDDGSKDDSYELAQLPRAEKIKKSFPPQN